MELLSQTPNSTLESEVRAYCEVVNCALADNEKRFSAALQRAYLPLTPANFLERCRDGVVMAHILANAVPSAAPHLAALQLPNRGTAATAAAMSQYFASTANVEVVLGAMARACGIVVVNIGAADIVEMRRECVLAVLWQVVRVHLLCHVSVLSTPELVVLVEPNETLEALIGEKPEAVLVRWVNYHVGRSAYNAAGRRLQHIPRDLLDCQIYAWLMAQVAPHIVTPASMEAFARCEHFTTKAHLVVEMSRALGCNQYVEAGDVVQGNAKLTLAFLSEIFNRHIGICLETLDAATHDVARICALCSELKGRIANAS